MSHNKSLGIHVLADFGFSSAMAKFADLLDPITGDFEGSTLAYCVDGFCIAMGSLMGMSPVTAYVESSTGISDGGKTGITAMTSASNDLRNRADADDLDSEFRLLHRCFLLAYFLVSMVFPFVLL